MPLGPEPWNNWHLLRAPRVAVWHERPQPQVHKESAPDGSRHTRMPEQLCPRWPATSGSPKKHTAGTKSPLLTGSAGMEVM